MGISLTKSENFNYSILKSHLEKADKGKKNLILLSTGSYNPIHRMHLKIFQLAYDHLKSLNLYNILCCFISPSADCYVKHKKPPLIPFNLRCKMIESAIKEYKEEKKDEELNIYLHKWEGSQKKFFDYPDVIKKIQHDINAYFKDIQLIYVCGMDHFFHCKNVLTKNVIAIDRKPFINSKLKDDPTKLLFMTKDEENDTDIYSSSNIRDFYKKNDLENINKITFPNVAKMIIDFYGDNFYKK